MAGEPCAVTIKINGVAVATVKSEEPRPDLHAKQQSRGLGGWQADIGQSFEYGENQVEVIFVDGSHLRGSPFTHDPHGANADALAPVATEGPKNYVCAIDTPDADTISGWSIGSDFKSAAVMIHVNDRPPIMILADTDRPDLIAQELTRSGGGWRYDVGPMLVPGLNRIKITFPNGTHLPGSPIHRQIGASAAPVFSPDPPPAPKAAPKPAPVAAPAAAAPRPAAVPPPARPSQRPVAPAANPLARMTTVPVPQHPVPAPPPGPAKVAPFAGSIGGKNGMPSLSELDELSLDDLSLAIAAGMINVTPSSKHEPVPDPVMAQAKDEQFEDSARKGFFSRLLRRG
jgi:pyruvate/2-oxoglutarate dehydrogenase complex dihydrolipoamide acyltransferase (E2) component